MAAWQSLPLKSVRITDPFWSSWQKTIADVTLEQQYQQCVETGRIENFRRAARGEKGTYQGRYYNDSDVYKWMEAASHALAAGLAGADVRRRLDEVAEVVIAAQEPDGYLSAYFTVNAPNLKFRNLAAMHEMYCMGHYLEAAVAHHAATGQNTVLESAQRLADLLVGRFGPGKEPGYCGHEELEIGMLKLAKATGDARYAEFAKYQIDARGQRPSILEENLKDEEAQKLSPWMKRMLSQPGDGTQPYSGSYVQDHLPVRQTKEAVGHAVRAMYLYTAATEAFVPQDEEMTSALSTIWDNMVQRRMYVTGGIGDEGAHEGFTRDFRLPNRTAYAETCAACGVVFWALRWLHATGDASYLEILETALYNGMLAGMSPHGDKFFYENPLESFGDHHRQPWFDCACCPPNVARVLAALGNLVCGVREGAFAVFLPVAFEASFEVSGVPVTVKLTGDLLGDGKMKLTVDATKPVRFELQLRLPDWAENIEFDMPDEYGEMAFDCGFAWLDREWSSGDSIGILLEAEPKWLVADPRNLDCLGRVALRYGPLIYCAEEAGNGFAPQAYAVDPEGELELQPGEAPLGLTQIVANGVVTMPAVEGEAAQPYEGFDAEERPIHLIPYLAWDNREPGPMQVWLRALI